MKENDFKDLVFKLRFYQKSYQQSKSNHTLLTVQSLEKEVDNELHYLELQRRGVSKKPPISDLFQDLK